MEADVEISPLAGSRPPDSRWRTSLTFRKSAGIAAAALLLIGCEKAPTYRPQQPEISYSTREAGSVAVPSNDQSFKLISLPGPERLSSFQQIITTKGEVCSLVTSAVFKDGLDGIDEWRVQCLDSGDWNVTFRVDGSVNVVDCVSNDCV